MANFNLALSKVLSHEGGYVNDSNDLGGETYKGIALEFSRFMSLVGKSFDQSRKDKSFPVNLADNVNLQQSVEQFYLKTFWQPLKADQIQNQTPSESVFDFAVNSGIATSIRLVQSIVGTKIDGIMGKQTLNKINSIDFGYFQAVFTISKINYFMAIIKKTTSQQKISLWLDYPRPILQRLINQILIQKIGLNIIHLLGVYNVIFHYQLLIKLPCQHKL